uniref:GATA-type domain-containing protein n=1 Tax=Haptolina ericina TaxID=156174 RepID=A0A7S3FBJ5_9EUKA|mmetsp:Transcript_59320/g.132143  ORF Transcript_59320/g.132143 Transcript_59320/m.132143 type:complete len:138 (+) Transcript_59320:42-455(+)
MPVCVACGSTDSVKWRNERTLCNACGLAKSKGTTRDPTPTKTKGTPTKAKGTPTKSPSATTPGGSIASRRTRPAASPVRKRDVESATAPTTKEQLVVAAPAAEPTPPDVYQRARGVGLLVVPLLLIGAYFLGRLSVH